MGRGAHATGFFSAAGEPDVPGREARGGADLHIFVNISRLGEGLIYLPCETEFPAQPVNHLDGG